MDWIIIIASWIVSGIFLIIVGVSEANKYYGSTKLNRCGLPKIKRVWRGWK